MSPPKIWAYFGEDVKKATEEILEYFSRTPSYTDKVFYVDGWNGFGATAVLRSIEAVLPSWKSTPELCFDRVIFIDCSDWKSKRAMQREITKELKFYSSVMGIFDKQDEEDDFRGVDQGSRDVILSVAAMIYQTLTSNRFMMIFLNGSEDEVDVTRFGIPQFTEFSNNKMMWTFSRRCLTINNEKSKLVNKLGYTHVFMCPEVNINTLTDVEFDDLLRQEAAAIIPHIPCILEIHPNMVEDCCLYDLFLYLNFHTSTKFAWVAHASNYWICDGIIQGDRASDISNALYREINWKCDPSLLDGVLRLFNVPYMYFRVLKDDDVYKENQYRWISVTSKNRNLHGLQTIPAATSSFFLAFEESNQSSTLPNGLFDHSNKLGVLVLCSCAFNFASPPFRRCHNLRFLGLDHCTDDKTREGDDHTGWLCLYKLWVLELRHTDWKEILSREKMDLMKDIRELNIEGVRGWQYTSVLQGRLPNLQRLRIINPTCPWLTSNDADNFFTDKTSMEILDLSGNSDMENLPTSLSKASGLQVLILDGCDGLDDIVALGRLPPSLKSFSFDGYGPASQRTPTAELPAKHFRPSTAEDEKDISTSKISLEGCTKLDNLFVRGLNNLVELDLSGTAIRILDFKTLVVQVPRLKRLFLIGCKHLRAIIFLDESGSTTLTPDLELMCIDTRTGIVCPRPFINKTKSFRLQVHAIVVDARIAYSFQQLLQRLRGRPEDVYYNIHVTSSPVYDWAVQFEETYDEKFDHCDQGSLQQLIPECQYNDVLSMVGDPPMQAFPLPPATPLDRHIEIAEGSCYVESELEREGELGKLMGYYAKSMYVHDVSIRHLIRKVRYSWDYLRWCRVERCPKLDTVFPESSCGFHSFEIFWASDLLMARWICSKGSRYGLFTTNTSSFRNLQHLHLRSCPRLQFVLPVWVSSFPVLETLHIIHCGDLVHVFELDGWHPRGAVRFPKLTTIHLHDLPKLHQICEVEMVAPALETIKIRGCWGLRRLPSAAARALGAKKPTIEIEQDVWDSLEWDDDHRPDHFEKPIHCLYYKKKLPRVSFLR